MNEFEALKKRIQCTTCLDTYQNNSNKHYCTVCFYHACSSCYQIYGPHCSYGDLHKWSKTKVQIDENTNKLLKIMDEMSIKNTEAQQENEKLKTEIVICKSQIRREVPPKENNNSHETKEDHYKCMDCEGSEAEQKAQLCATCHGKDFENLVTRALCASCAIQKHMRNGHEIVDFYPYLRAVNFNSRSTEFTSESASLKNVRDSFNSTVQKFNDLSSNVSENLNVLADRARRSNSTKNQSEFFDKIKDFVDESKLVHVNADNELKKQVDILEKNLANIKNWCEARNGNCVDDSETIKTN